MGHQPADFKALLDNDPILIIDQCSQDQHSANQRPHDHSAVLQQDDPLENSSGGEASSLSSFLTSAAKTSTSPALRRPSPAKAPQAACAPGRFAPATPASP